MSLRAVCLAALLVPALLSGAAAHAQPDAVFYHGINLAGADFAPQKLPGINATDYLWPSAGDIDMFASIGANIFRVPFLWERMQPQLNGPLDAAELSRLDALAQEAAARHAVLVLDVHNYGGYRGNWIGSEAVPASAFADLWTRLAAHYKDQPAVGFGLMNEPHEQKADEWAAIAQQAIEAIRQTGATQIIFVPGTGWTGAHSWQDKAGAMSNAEAIATITDPAHHLVIEAHQYFDQDSSGTHSTCVSEDIGEKQLAAFTAWLRQTGNKGLLGEFGASKDPVCMAALRRTLTYVSANKDVWYGWTYWAAAKWFGTYMFNVYPPDPNKFPQAGVLKQAMQKGGS
jgi:endoglucanase